jgi:hypothetical protein
VQGYQFGLFPRHSYTATIGNETVSSYDYSDFENVSTSIRWNYAVTDIRTDPLFVTLYVNWSTMIATGVIPMTLLVYFNLRVLFMHIFIKFRDKAVSNNFNYRSTRLSRTTTSARRRPSHRWRLRYNEMCVVSCFCGESHGCLCHQFSLFLPGATKSLVTFSQGKPSFFVFFS